ncbi:MAG TPA: alginate lyase family protein [Candidatus Kapabacteria bacterium]|nr:alginate lyase family protein [Candidatus Kapabacteria bacterium]
MADKKLARRFQFLIASAKRHGPAHVVEVFRQELRRRRYAASPIPPPAPAHLAESFPPVAAGTNFLEAFHRNASGRLPFTAEGRSGGLMERLLTLQSRRNMERDAELFAAGHFEALGLCLAGGTSTYNWAMDYGCGHVWPAAPFDAIRFLDVPGADVKYVWELNRMYWIGWLGKAWWATDDERWAREFTTRLESWRTANPVNTGINWTMPMEVAIRGFWLVQGYAFFHGAPGISDDWWLEYLALAWGHGSYLENNLEYFSNLTNHYISNCFGMVMLGSLFAGSAEGDRWLREGRRRLLAELEHQVLPDGVHYERSICYHRLVLEMYLITIAALERCGHPFPQQALAHVERMAEFMRDYIPENGTVPQLGDSDDGVILRLSIEQELYDHRDTLALAAAVFGRSDFDTTAGGTSQAALLMADDAAAPGNRNAAEGTPKRASRLYRNGGFAALRGNGMYVFADVGPIGLHGNNDTLSFTLHGRSGAFIVDPGTYCYSRDADLRNELRSSLAHNAPVVDGAEIAEFSGLWRVRDDRTDVTIMEWNPTESGATLHAEHHAYGRLPGGGVLVRRRWKLDGDELHVLDSFVANHPHRVVTRFTLPAEVMVVQLDPNRLELHRPSGERMQMEASAPLTLAEGWHSPSYGVAAQATLIGTSGQIGAGTNAPNQFAYIYRLLP